MWALATLANPQRAVVQTAAVVGVVTLLVFAQDGAPWASHALIGARRVSKTPQLPMIMKWWRRVMDGKMSTETTF